MEMMIYMYWIEYLILTASMENKDVWKKNTYCVYLQFITWEHSQKLMMYFTLYNIVTLQKYADKSENNNNITSYNSSACFNQ